MRKIVENILDLYLTYAKPIPQTNNYAYLAAYYNINWYGFYFILTFYSGKNVWILKDIFGKLHTVQNWSKLLWQKLKLDVNNAKEKWRSFYLIDTYVINLVGVNSMENSWSWRKTVYTKLWLFLQFLCHKCRVSN